MKLHEQWKLIAVKAWSMRFMALAAVCAMITTVTSLYPALVTMTPSRAIWLALLTLVFTFLGMWARIVAQKEFKDG